MRVTVGRRGVTRTVGLPGTGIFYTSRTGTQTGAHRRESDSGGHTPGQRRRLECRLSQRASAQKEAHTVNLGYGRYIVTPDLSTINRP